MVCGQRHDRRVMFVAFQGSSGSCVELGSDGRTCVATDVDDDVGASVVYEDLEDDYYLEEDVRVSDSFPGIDVVNMSSVIDAIHRFTPPEFLNDTRIRDEEEEATAHHNGLHVSGPIIAPSPNLFIDWKTKTIINASSQPSTSNEEDDDDDDDDAPIVFQSDISQLKSLGDTDDVFTRLYGSLANAKDPRDDDHKSLVSLVSVTWHRREATPRKLLKASSWFSATDRVIQHSFNALPVDPGASLAGRQVTCAVRAEPTTGALVCLTVCLTPHRGLDDTDEASSLTYWLDGTRHTSVTRPGLGPSTLIPGSLCAWHDVLSGDWVIAWGVVSLPSSPVHRAWMEAFVVNGETGGVVSRGVPTPWVASPVLMTGGGRGCSMRLDGPRLLLWSMESVLVTSFTKGGWCPARTMHTPIPAVSWDLDVVDVSVDHEGEGVLVLWHDGADGVPFVQRVDGTGVPRALDIPGTPVRAVAGIESARRPRFSTLFGGISGTTDGGRVLFIGSGLRRHPRQRGLTTGVTMGVDELAHLDDVRRVQLAWAQTVASRGGRLHSLAGLGARPDFVVWPVSTRLRLRTVYGAWVSTFLTSMVHTFGYVATSSVGDIPVAFLRYIFHGFPSGAIADACVPHPVLSLPRLPRFGDDDDDDHGVAWLPSWVRDLERSWFLFDDSDTETLTRSRLHAVFEAASEAVLHDEGFRLESSSSSSSILDATFGVVLSVLAASVLCDGNNAVLDAVRAAAPGLVQAVRVHTTPGVMTVHQLASNLCVFIGESELPLAGRDTSTAPSARSVDVRPSLSADTFSTLNELFKTFGARTVDDEEGPGDTAFRVVLTPPRTKVPGALMRVADADAELAAVARCLRLDVQVDCGAMSVAVPLPSSWAFEDGDEVPHPRIAAAGSTTPPAPQSSWVRGGRDRAVDALVSGAMEALRSVPEADRHVEFVTPYVSPGRRKGLTMGVLTLADGARAFAGRDDDEVMDVADWAPRSTLVLRNS